MQVVLGIRRVAADAQKNVPDPLGHLAHHHFSPWSRLAGPAGGQELVEPLRVMLRERGRDPDIPQLPVITALVRLDEFAQTGDGQSPFSVEVGGLVVELVEPEPPFAEGELGEFCKIASASCALTQPRTS